MTKDSMDLITMTEEQFIAFMQKAGLIAELPKS